MLSGETILAFGLLPWDSIRQRPHHLALGLAKRNRVIYVDPSKSLLHVLIPALRRKMISRNIFPSCRPLTECLYLYAPPLNLPHVWKARWLNRVNKALILLHLKKTLRHMGVQHPILWLSSPTDLDYVGKFGEKLVWYDCMDDFPAYYGGKRRRNLNNMAKELLHKVDLVTVCAETMHRKVPGSFVVPNGAELDHFGRIGKATDQKEVPPYPPDLVGLKQPIIGFIGYVGEWVNLELLAGLARVRPEWSIVVIGPIYRAIHAYRHVPNLYFLGEKDYADIPHYLATFRVCVIPFLINDLTLAMNPVKVYEYLAAGKPVVSTDLLEVRSFGQVCKLARTEEEFLRYTEMFVSETAGQAGQHRLAEQCRALVRDHDWQQRVHEISRLLALRLRREI